MLWLISESTKNQDGMHDIWVPNVPKKYSWSTIDLPGIEVNLGTAKDSIPFGFWAAIFPSNLSRKLGASELFI